MQSDTPNVDPHARGLSLLRAIPPDRFTFLTVERREVYLTILLILHRHRRAHEFEVYYDELQMETLLAYPGTMQAPYDSDAFRQDLEALAGWKNVTPRLEPRRIETLADRRLRKFLCRLDDPTVQILEFLQASADATAAITDHGRHLLADAAESLAQANSLLRRTSADEGREESIQDTLKRAGYLIVESHRKVDEAAKELVRFDQDLVEFGRNPFKITALAGVVDRLQRYVDDYVAKASEDAKRIHDQSKKLLISYGNDLLAQAQIVVHEEVRADPLLSASAAAAPDLAQMLTAHVAFFKRAGSFEGLLDRVHEAARQVVRRVHAHVESVRRRNIVIQTLRDRTREIARVPEAHVPDVNTWFNSLYASGHIVTDLRPGTPETPSKLPRPRRRQEYARPAHRGGYFTPKKGTPTEARALARRKLEILNEFIEAKVLQGREEAKIGEADLTDLSDLRSLMEAIKAHSLRERRFQRHLTYRIRPHHADESAKVEIPEGSLTLTNSTFARHRKA